MEFRTKHLYNWRVHRFYERNEAVFKKMTEPYMYFGKQCMSLSDVVSVVHTIGGLTWLPTHTITRLYGFSKSSVVDLTKFYASQS